MDISVCYSCLCTSGCYRKFHEGAHSEYRAIDLLLSDDRDCADHPVVTESGNPIGQLFEILPHVSAHALARTFSLRRIWSDATNTLQLLERVYEFLGQQYRSCAEYSKRGTRSSLLMLGTVCTPAWKPPWPRATSSAESSRGLLRGSLVVHHVDPASTSTANDAAFPSKGDISLPLFDHLVGKREQRRRNFEAERLGCLEIDHQLELGGAVDRQLGRLGAPEDTAGLDACASIRVRKAVAVAD